MDDLRYLTSDTQWYLPEGVECVMATEDERREMARRLALDARKTIDIQKKARDNARLHRRSFEH